MRVATVAVTQRELGWRADSPRPRKREAENAAAEGATKFVFHVARDGLFSEAPLAKQRLKVPSDDLVEGRPLRAAAGVLLRLPVRRRGPRRTGRTCRLVADGDHRRFSRCHWGPHWGPSEDERARRPRPATHSEILATSPGPGPCIPLGQERGCWLPPCLSQGLRKPRVRGCDAKRLLRMVGERASLTSA